MLEPYAVKVACTVLRGERSRETPDLLGGEKIVISLLRWYFLDMKTIKEEKI